MEYGGWQKNVETKVVLEGMLVKFATRQIFIERN